MDVIRVVDVPMGTSADEAQRLLNVPCSVNRYLLVQVFLLPNGVTRAFYRLLAKAARTNPNPANRDSNDDAAKAIIRANGTLTIPALIKLLADNGIKRGKTWVAETRMKRR